METNTTLNSYITTPNIIFNRFAMKLYLENFKQDAFEMDEKPLWIFKSIAGMATTHAGNFFSFVDEFEPFIDTQELSTPERLLLYGIVKDYFKTMANKYQNHNYEDYYDDYHGYFATLEELMVKDNTDAILANTDISGMLNDIVHRQMLKLSGDLDSIPVAQKAKVITSLFKALPAGNKKGQENNNIELLPASRIHDDPSGTVLEFNPSAL